MYRLYVFAKYEMRKGTATAYFLNREARQDNDDKPGWCFLRRWAQESKLQADGKQVSHARKIAVLFSETNLVARPVRYVALAVQPQAPAVGIEHHHRVEERVVTTLEKTDREDLVPSFWCRFSGVSLGFPRAMIGSVTCETCTSVVCGGVSLYTGAQREGDGCRGWNLARAYGKMWNAAINSASYSPPLAPSQAPETAQGGSSLLRSRRARSAPPSAPGRSTSSRTAPEARSPVGSMWAEKQSNEVVESQPMPPCSSCGICRRSKQLRPTLQISYFYNTLCDVIYTRDTAVYYL